MRKQDITNDAPNTITTDIIIINNTNKSLSNNQTEGDQKE